MYAPIHSLSCIRIPCTKWNKKGLKMIAKFARLCIHDLLDVSMEIDAGSCSTERDVETLKHTLKQA